MDNLSNFWDKVPRAGLNDLWNSELCEGAEWTNLDNPKVYCTATQPPENITSWIRAKELHKRNIAIGNKNYHENSFIHCCIDDQKFDGENEGIWKKWKFFYSVASHFDGITGIDFSTNADFPEPVKRFQLYKMRVIEHGAIQRAIPVIPNARWGTQETWNYCFDGLPESSTLCIGAVGSGLNCLENRSLFEMGLRELIKQKKPRALVVIGSAKYQIFQEAQDKGIEVHQFDSETCSFFKKKGGANV